MEAQLSPTGRFEKILLATDGSEYSAGAVRLALALARKCGSRLHAMMVVITNDEAQALAPQLIASAEQAAKSHLEAVARDAASVGVDCDILLRQGDDPAQQIVDEAEALRADVIVVGRRGRRGFARWLMGDITTKVIGRACCSVLVAPRAAKIWQRRILLATDGSRYSDAAAIAAGNLAQGCALPLTVVSVTTESHSAKRCEEARQAVDRVLTLTRGDVDTEGLVVQGRPYEAIIETAANKAADLVVVGSHGRTGLTKMMLGSTSERVIQESQWPVLVVKV